MFMNIRKNQTDCLKTHEIFRQILRFIVLPFCIVFFLVNYVVLPIRIDGNSMYPTIKGGSIAFVSKLHHEYSSGDIILFSLKNGEFSDVPMVKRIIAGPNQIVKIDNCFVYVDNNLLDEKYAFYECANELDALEFSVPENHYFVLGDNRCNSIDSRDMAIGFIPSDCIIGEVIR